MRPKLFVELSLSLFLASTEAERDPFKGLSLHT